MRFIDVAYMGRKIRAEKVNAPLVRPRNNRERAFRIDKESVMKSNVKGLIIAVLVFGVQSLVSGNALAYYGADKIWVKAEHVEGSAFPRSAMDD